jgi:hypothetical protein
MTTRSSRTKSTEAVANELDLDTSHIHEDIPLSKKDLENIASIIRAIDSLGFEEFIEYIKSPWRLILPNLVAGIARGVGTLLGATIVIAIITWFIAKLAVIPLIGQYFGQIQTETQKYIEATNYSDEFRDMGSLLREIRDELKTAQPKE